MWFLIKCAFWLGLVLLFIPVPESQQRPGVHYVSTGETVSALTAALADVRGFCTRNPDACATGAAAMQTMGDRAQAGARMLSDFIAEQLDRSRDLVPPPGSRAVEQRPQAERARIERAPPAPGARDTLSPADLVPEWRAPSPAPSERRV